MGRPPRENTVTPPLLSPTATRESRLRGEEMMVMDVTESPTNVPATQGWGGGEVS